MNKKSELALSTLILLISMILVSAIIFYVFMESTSQVSQEAKGVAMVAKVSVGTASHFSKVYAEDGSSGSVNYFYAELKAPYGSDEFKLTDSLLMLSMNNASDEYEYNSSVNCSIKDASDTTSIYNETNADYFGVQYVRGSATYTDTVMPGEYVRFCFKSPRSVAKDDKVVLTFLTKHGYASRLELRYQKLMRETSIYFFP